MESLLITSGRATLATDVIGSGEPIVFLHARVADRRMWRQQMRDIGDSHQAIAYDRRGFGETVAEAEDHSAVEDLIAVLESVAGGALQYSLHVLKAEALHSTQLSGIRRMFAVSF